jgi:hypothetical protein
MADGRPARIFPALVRLFFSRFFDKEFLFSQGEPEADIIQIHIYRERSWQPIPSTACPTS